MKPRKRKQRPRTSATPKKAFKRLARSAKRNEAMTNDSNKIPPQESRLREGGVRLVFWT